MNDKLSYEAINGIIGAINQGLDKAPDYVVELVDRYQNYYIISNGFGAFCGLVGFIFGIILTTNGIRNEEEGQIFCGVLLILFGFILLGCFTFSLIQGIFVPEIALIQSFSSCGH